MGQREGTRWEATTASGQRETQRRSKDPPWHTAGEGRCDAGTRSSYALHRATRSSLLLVSGHFKSVKKKKQANKNPVICNAGECVVRQAGHFTSLSFEWLPCEIGMTTWPFVAIGDGNEVTNVKPVCKQSLANHIAVGVPMMMTCLSSPAQQAPKGRDPA